MSFQCGWISFLKYQQNVILLIACRSWLGHKLRLMWMRYLPSLLDYHWIISQDCGHFPCPEGNFKQAHFWLVVNGITSFGVGALMYNRLHLHLDSQSLTAVLSDSSRRSVGKLVCYFSLLRKIWNVQLQDRTPFGHEMWRFQDCACGKHGELEKRDIAKDEGGGERNRRVTIWLEQKSCIGHVRVFIRY